MNIISHTYNPVTEKVVPKSAIVLDLDEITSHIGRRDVGEVLQALRHEKDPAVNFITNSKIAGAIEAQTKPPRIPEPGLYGVVEDAKGARYVRESQDGLWRWFNIDVRPDRNTKWDDIVDPTLVRDGIGSDA